MNDRHEVLAEAAEALAHAGACLAELAQYEDAPQSDPEAEAAFLRGARRELDELIRSIEGPGPHPTRRR